MAGDRMAARNHLFAAASGTPRHGLLNVSTAALGANYSISRINPCTAVSWVSLSRSLASAAVVYLLCTTSFYVAHVVVYFLAFFAGGIDLLAAFFVGHPKHLALHPPRGRIHRSSPPGPGVPGHSGAHPLGRMGMCASSLVVAAPASRGGWNTARRHDTKFTGSRCVCADSRTWRRACRCRFRGGGNGKTTSSSSRCCSRRAVRRVVGGYGATRIQAL